MALFNYECDEVKRKIDEVSPNYPQLTTFEKEWLFFHKYHYIPGIPVELEHETVSVNPTGSVLNAIPFQYESAILKGATKYRDIDTGDILDTFDETKNIELVSVRMPVLTTTGKNLFDGVLANGTLGDNTGEVIGADSPKHKHTYNYIKVEPNSDFGIYYETENYSGVSKIFFYDKNKKYLKLTTNIEVSTTGSYAPKVSKTIRIPNNSEIHYAKLRFFDGDNVGEVAPKNITIIKTSNKITSYEPYKSNILRVNEEVELRGIGDVKDTLDLMTGEVTEHIGEIVLDGSDDEDWTILTSTSSGATYFRCAINNLQPSGDQTIIPPNLINDKLPLVKYYDMYTGVVTDNVAITSGSTVQAIFVWNSNIKKTESAIRNYLQQNPITVQYQLAKESVKTVNLTTLNKPYEGTNHYQLEANIPCEAILEVPVVSTGKQTLEDINN